MKELLFIFVFITTSLSVIILNGLFISRKTQVRGRLDSIQSMFPSYDSDEVFKKSLFQRIIRPTYEEILKFIGNIAPQEIKQKYERIINYAGSPKNTTFINIFINQLIGFLLFGGISFYIFSQRGKLNFPLIICASIIGFIFPVSLIRIKADKRQKKIKMELPNMLDLLYVSVEAGLSFDTALKKTAEKMPGPLSEEIGKVLDEISKGRSRRESLRGMVLRTGVEDLSYFVTSIIQTEQLGSNIANMLRIQANTMRQKRKQRAEEAAMKVPIKMMFPLVFFILPSLFIVVLGPAIIKIASVINQLI